MRPSHHMRSHLSLVAAWCLVLAGSGVAVLSLAAPADAAVADLRINEVESSDGANPDWVEIANVGTTAVDASGLVLRDSNPAPGEALGAGTTIQPGGLLAIDLTATVTLDDADAIRLFATDGTTLLDSYAWTAPASTTYARCPNGTGPFATSAAPTKGTANVCPDTVAPVVSITGVTSGATYFGAAPAAGCTASDAVSGPLPCSLARTPGEGRANHAVTVTATATDGAGNVGTASVTSIVEQVVVRGAPYRKGVFVVKRGKKYAVLAFSATKPTLLLPASVPTTPTETGPRMKKIGEGAGLGIWRAKVRMTRSEYGPFWYLGFRTDNLYLARLKPSGKRQGPGPADL